MTKPEKQKIVWSIVLTQMVVDHGFVALGSVLVHHGTGVPFADVVMTALGALWIWRGVEKS